MKRLTSAEVDELVAKFPKLVSRERSPKSSPQSLAARNIRSMLKHHFPKVTFKVSTNSYNGGCRIDVRWVAWEDQNPPTIEQVKDVVGVFSEHARARDVDPYNDGYQYDRNEARNAFRATFGCARHVHFTSLEPTEEDLAERRAGKLEEAFKAKSSPSPRIRM